jgi:excisionase family DNA binding protein
LAQFPGGPDAIRFLTRRELAEALSISLRTVDEMVANGEVPVVRIRGAVRFYLPDVVRALTANAVTSKRGCARRLMAAAIEGSKPSVVAQKGAPK